MQRSVSLRLCAHLSSCTHFQLKICVTQRSLLSFAFDSGVQALKAANVDFIVAPFEADAQMAYLAVNGLVHAVITEDSDLLPYGCPRVRHTHICSLNHDLA